MNPNVLKVQTRLKQLGYDPGPLDGIRGTKTINAIRQFQRNHGLTVDGLVGSITFAALFPDESTPVAPSKGSQLDAFPWIDEAYRVKGLHEVRDNKRLWDWLKKGGSTLGDPAKNSWCGAFTKACISQTLPNEPFPENPYLAANWRKFGIACTPQYGALLVFWRGSPTSWQGHIGFYIGETATHYRVLGGNQSDAVTDNALIAKNRLRPNGVRWPSTAMEPPGRVVKVDGKGGVISVNEA